MNTAENANSTVNTEDLKKVGLAFARLGVSLIKCIVTSAKAAEPYVNKLSDWVKEEEDSATAK